MPGMGRPFPTSTFKAACVGVVAVAFPPAAGCCCCAFAASGGLATSAAAPAAAPLRNPRRPSGFVFLELAIAPLRLHRLTAERVVGCRRRRWEVGCGVVEGVLLGFGWNHRTMKPYPLRLNPWLRPLSFT